MFIKLHEIRSNALLAVRAKDVHSMTEVEAYDNNPKHTALNVEPNSVIRVTESIDTIIELIYIALKQ